MSNNFLHQAYDKNFSPYNNNLAQAVAHINGNNPNYSFENSQREPLTVQRMAKALNGTPKKVCKALKQLQEAGLISENFNGEDSDDLCFRLLQAPSLEKSAKNVMNPNLLEELERQGVI